MNKLPASFIFFITLFLFTSCSKRVENPRWVINEVLVTNEENFVDNYGNRSGWIELFNNTARTQDIGGYFLTNDKSNPKKYPIPKGDVLTKIAPHQHILFWANNKPHNGTFHISFELDPSIENYIALYDESGTKLIDEITIPAGQIPDVSWGYDMDGHKYDEDGNLQLVELQKVTPSTNNFTLDKNEKIERFRQHDKFGASMTITAMVVVFFALVLLFFAFRLIGKTSKKLSQKRSQNATANAPQGTATATVPSEVSGEVLAAIFMALHEEQSNAHDIEHNILTFNKVNKSYSPWSSKIYGMRELPRR